MSDPAPTGHPTSPSPPIVQDRASARSGAGPTFASILFPGAAPEAHPAGRAEPACFADLNLDQVVSDVTAGWADYDLVGYFQAPLTRAPDVAFRQAVMADVQSPDVLAALQRFSKQMREVREGMAALAGYPNPPERQRRWLNQILKYDHALVQLLESLSGCQLHSTGMIGFVQFLSSHLDNPAVAQRRSTARALNSQLRGITYCMLVRSNTITVRPYAGEDDLAAELGQFFAKFSPSPAVGAPPSTTRDARLNPLEAQILARVTALFPEPFAALAEFSAAEQQFIDPVILRFEREIQFYVAYLSMVHRLQGVGLKFCYPEFTQEGLEVDVTDAFDLALATKALSRGMDVVCNDVRLTPPEHLLVVTGPNQGGKTTFARMFGQLHWLAALGCPVPGRRARLAAFDQMLTHFDRAEQVTDLRGKLLDDLHRVREILLRATPGSIVILNELFSSTALADAVVLNRRILAKLVGLGVRCVCVTFIDELAQFDELTVSLVAGIDPEDPARRTFSFVRRPADGLAYAQAIAEKHRVTFEAIVERIGA